MDHLSEILKILDGALRHNIEQAVSYAGLLAEKLERDGEAGQAKLIRQRLAKLPQTQVAAQLAEIGPPRDRESAVPMADESFPDESALHLVLAPPVRERLEEFLLAIKSHDRLAAEGFELPARLLLHGPPGCGKTLIARWIAARLNLSLLTVRCDSLISSLLGQSSRNLRLVFEHAESRPCVLFLDEFDALGKARSDEREVGELQRIVISVLQNIDALSPATILIGATNHEELLDRAVWRRFTMALPILLPGRLEREDLWRQKLGRFAPADTETVALLGRFSERLSGAAIETVAYECVREAVVHNMDSLSIPAVMRRIARTRALTAGEGPRDEVEEIRLLRDWAPEVFTYRALESLFKRSARQVRNALEVRDEPHRQSHS